MEDLDFDEEKFWEEYDKDTPEQIAEYEKEFEETLREIRTERHSTYVWDPVSGDYISGKQFESKYGERLAEEAYKYRVKGEHYPNALIKSIHQSFNRFAKASTNVIPFNKKVTSNVVGQNAQRKAKEQYRSVAFSFLDKVKESKCHKNATALLFTLYRHRSWEGKRDRNHTYEYWYKKKGLIVASRSMAKLSEDIGVTEKTISRWLKDLEANGDIRIVKGKSQGYKRDNIYVLGEVDKNGNEILYHS